MFFQVWESMIQSTGQELWKMGKGAICVGWLGFSGTSHTGNWPDLTEKAGIWKDRKERGKGVYSWMRPTLLWDFTRNDLGGKEPSSAGIGYRHLEASARAWERASYSSRCGS